MRKIAIISRSYTSFLNCLPRNVNHLSKRGFSLFNLLVNHKIQLIFAASKNNPKIKKQIVMKKQVILAFLIVVSTIVHAQNNTFPSSGNVGIGTTTPAEKLHINGSVRGNIGSGALRIKSSTGYIDIGAQNTSWAHIYTDRPNIIFNKDVYTSTNAFSSYSDDLIFKTKGVERLRIDDLYGNVGIGTTTPVSKLEVNGDISLFRNNKIKFLTAVGGQDRAYIRSSNGENGDYNSLIFAIGDGNESMIIKANDGNVGIGTKTPDAKLAVNGDIHAKEVKLDLVGWPDYVFEEDYELSSLTEVEQHIQEKGHLPNIPSATEIEKNGAKLGEINKKLLEKIEELTLYTIAQEKKLTDQEERIKKLEALLLSDK